MDFLGRIRKLDNSLQRGLDNGLARVFGGKVVPNELEECLKQEIDDFLMQDANGQYLAPNDFRIGVSPSDFDNLSSNEPDLPGQLAERMTRYCRNNGWTTSGPMVIHLQVVENLHTGQLKTASHFAESTPEPSGYIGADGSEVDVDIAGPHDGAPNDDNPPVGNHRWSDAPEPDRAPTSAEYHPQPDRDAGSVGVGNVNEGASASAAAASAAAASAAAAGTGAAIGTGAAAASAAAAERHEPSRASEPSHTADPSPSSESSFDEWDSEPFPTASRPAASPAPAQAVEQSAPSVTLLLQDGSNRIFEVRPGSNIIGRGTASDFRLPDTGVSRQHAEITWDGSDAVLVDLHSTNGTIVNGEPIDNWLLADGDIISMGHSVMEVRVR